MSVGDDILRAMYPKEDVVEMAKVCDECHLPMTLHRKTIGGQLFHLGCGHAKWLKGAYGARMGGK